ncbi:hypothetical protein ACFL43_07120, partial [Thermodesulfobacteriota bacterium]
MRRILTTCCVLALLVGFTALPARGATNEAINTAIHSGLAYIASQQLTNGAFGSQYPLASTAGAVQTFAEAGHFPDAGNTYSAAVEDGLDYIFTLARTTAISVQQFGDPDTNGNGQGVYFQQQSSPMYETGMVLQAIVASNTPSRVVTTGPCAGRTYYDVITDVVDYLAWSQCSITSYYRGGWSYVPNQNRSDNDISRWATQALIAAERWGISAPAFVKTELNYWVTFIQVASGGYAGGSGYSNPGSIINMVKTGSLLAEFYYLGETAETARAQNALGFINNWWSRPPSSHYGNKGHYYAMYSIFKGLRLLGVETIPSALASPDTPAGDWWGDYCEYLLPRQLGNGSWSPYMWGSVPLNTAWVVSILLDGEAPEGIIIGAETPVDSFEVEGEPVEVIESEITVTEGGTPVEGAQVYIDVDVDNQSIADTSWTYRGKHKLVSPPAGPDGKTKLRFFKD